MQTIKDEFSDLPVSRQRKLQLRWKRDGRCVSCGNPKEHSGYVHCTACLDKVLGRQRAKFGFKPWTPGGRGRPPQRLLTQQQHPNSIP